MDFLLYNTENTERDQNTRGGMCQVLETFSIKYESCWQKRPKFQIDKADGGIGHGHCISGVYNGVMRCSYHRVSPHSVHSAQGDHCMVPIS